MKRDSKELGANAEMPIVRDPRNDRRRRILRENADDSASASKASKKRRRSDTQPDEAPLRRGAGYSQDVRRVCGHRLVQLIPVRRRSYIAVVFASLLIPSILLTLHYLVYVTDSFKWYGHPLALSLDANYPRGLAAWVTSQLWLLCLGATILTFQLRRHKLDDYNGDYRLWFWLVLTCVIGSLQSSTGIIELFAASLDHWSQLNLGWSGPTVVKATLAVLLGMLGLRLCTELKSVPTSVVFMLIGLCCWAGSAALGQQEFKLEMSLQHRAWLTASLWLTGMTSIWLGAVTYLRTIYIEAQHRFLLRGRLAASANAVPLKQRIRQSIPAMPSMPSFRRRDESDGETTATPKQRKAKQPTTLEEKQSRWTLPRFGRKRLPEEPLQESEQSQKKPTTESSTSSRISKGNQKRSSNQNTPHQRDSSNRNASPASKTADAEPKSRGLGGFLRRKGDAEQDGHSGDTTRSNTRNPKTNQDEESVSEPRLGKLSGWLRKPKDSDDADEFKKISREEARAERARKKEERKAERLARATEKKNASQRDDAQPRKSWIGKLKKPSIPKIGKPNFSGIKSRFKMPRLPSLRLLPPEEDGGDSSDEVTPKQKQRQLPSTKPANSHSAPKQGSSGNQGEPAPARPMSKAERKRLRRMQQQQDRAA